MSARRFLAPLVLTALLLASGARSALAEAALIPALSSGDPHPQESGALAEPAFTVDGRVALAAFMSLSDGHLRKMADSLRLISESAVARSADWQRIREPLKAVEKSNVSAVLWFALPDGSYWTLEQGRVTENLASRPYFPRVLAGQSVIGELVASRSTGKSVAIVAVPIIRPDKSVAGVLGASVHLDLLSALIRQEMSLDDSMIFYTFDAAPLLALGWDAGLIFVDPTKLGEAVGNAIKEMLSQEQGTVTYTFRERKRTVLYRKSSLSGWWHAFGVVHRERTGTSALPLRRSGLSFAWQFVEGAQK